MLERSVANLKALLVLASRALVLVLDICSGECYQAPLEEHVGTGRLKEAQEVHEGVWTVREGSNPAWDKHVTKELTGDDLNSTQ